RIPRRCGAPNRPGPRRGSCAHRLQRDGHGRSAAELAFDADGPALGGHQLLDDGKSKARAGAGRLGGEERVEDAREVLLAYPAAVVDDGELDAVAVSARG